MYTKTTWKNNVTDIDENNLNKIEQGIYDNSLVVDAVTNKLNPTDTETYKTAELTEGQITDVIGVNDIIIKGQTSQDGEPTPNSQVDVNVVSGNNVINIYNNQTLSKELPLDLPVENLFDSTLNTNTIGGVSINYNNDGSITLNGTATSDETGYVFSKYPSETSMCKLKANTSYTASIQKIAGNMSFGSLSESSSIQFWRPWDYSFQMFFDKISNNKLIVSRTPTTEIDLTRIQLSIKNGDVFNNFTIRVQFEQSSKANTYTPYGTDPIELCKIGNYQDYFYKRGSKWYLHKEIQKKVLNGSEEWTLRSGSRFDVDIPSADGDFISTGLSNQYKFIANWDTHIATNYSFTVRNGGWGINKCRISLINTDYNDVNAWKSYLSNNNIVVYYQKISQLGGATNTEITNTTLISQLEAIYNAPLYEQTNITQTNNDLPMVLDITACKDNINGIKAFIRK